MTNLITLTSSDFILLLGTLVLGLIYIKMVWIATEIKYFKQRVDKSLLKANAIELLILLLQVLIIFILPLPKTPYDGLITIVGVLLFISGVFFVLWGRSTIKLSWQQNHLVTGGAFAVSRNPIYLGFFFLYVGFCVAIQSWLIILRIPQFISFYKSAVAEEKVLEKNFGEKYLKYKGKVPRLLFGM